jgi:ATP-dependent Clp protease protease subunit
MAALILAGGAKGKRLVLPSSRVLIHQPSGGAQGQAMDVSIQTKEILRLKKLTIEYFAKHSGKDIATVAHDMERDFFMTAQDAVNYGLADRVLLRDKEKDKEKDGQTA